MRFVKRTCVIKWEYKFQVRSDWYVYAVLSSIPWVGRELFEKKEAEFERLLQTIENYIK